MPELAPVTSAFCPTRSFGMGSAFVAVELDTASFMRCDFLMLLGDDTVPAVDLFLPDDQAGAAGIGQPSPYPVEKDRGAIAKSDQEVEVDDTPQQPCERAGQLDPGKICYG